MSKVNTAIKHGILQRDMLFDRMVVGGFKVETENQLSTLTTPHYSSVHMPYHKIIWGHSISWRKILVTTLAFRYQIWQEIQLVWVWRHARIPGIKATGNIAMHLKSIDRIRITGNWKWNTVVKTVLYQRICCKL